MQRELEQSLNELLVRWHRWKAAPARVPDTLLQDFDAILARVGEPNLTALVVQARNLACGHQVWTTARPVGDIAEARSRLHNLLAADERRWYGPRVVKLNARGNRVGESNPMADLTDEEVDLLLELRAETNVDGKPRYSLSWLALKFEKPKSTISDICSGRRRCQAAVRTKEV